MPATNIEDYLKLDKPDTVWIWEGIIPRGGSCLLFGDPKTGKSKLALSLCEAVADPSIPYFLGLKIQHHGRVLYVQLDTPRNLWSSGYLSVITATQAKQDVYIIDREMTDLPKQFDIRIKECKEWLGRECERVKPTLVIVDTIRRMHKGNENESDTMALVHDSFIEAIGDAALLYLAHKKKIQQGEHGSGTVRGSSALTGAVDALVNMSKKKLTIEARSDVAEEIPIYQQDDGTFLLNSKEEEVGSFLSSMGPEMTKAEVDNAVAAQFKVSNRTARRWRKDFESGQS